MSQGRYLTVNIAGNRYRLAQRKDGTPAYDPTQVPPFSPQYTVGDVSESTMPPEFVPYSFDDFSGGFGLGVTPATGDTNRYRDIAGSIDASLSPDGPVILGPPLTTVTFSDSSHPGVFYGTALVGATTLFSTPSAGVGVYSYTSTTATLVGTLGAACTDVLLPFRGSQSQVYLYAPEGYSATPQYSTNTGVTWSNVTTSGGVDKTNNMVLIDGEVWVSLPGKVGNAAVARFNDGGTTPTLFGVIDPIGDPANQIDRLIEFNGRVVILKATEGAFLLANDRYSLEQNILPDLRRSGDQLLPFGAKVWRGILWLPTLRTLYAIGPGFGLQEVAPNTGGGGFSGSIQTVAGDSYNLYAYLYGGARGGGANGPPAEFLKAVVKISYGQVQSIAWHPIINTTGGDNTGSAMEVVQTATSASPQLVSYKAFKSAQATLVSITLPGQGPDPRTDSNYLYAASGTLFLPSCTKRFPGVNAQFLGLTPLNEELSFKWNNRTVATTAQSIQTGYRLPTDTAYTTNTALTTGTGTRDPLTGVRGRALEAEVVLASSDNTITPQLYALTLDYALQPPPLWQHAMTLDLTSGASAGDGSDGYGDPMTAETAMTVLPALPGGAAFQFTDPWGTQRTSLIKPGNLHPKLIRGPDAGYESGPGLYVDVTVTECQPRA